VAAVGDADALLAYVAHARPDMVVSDIRMPPSHGDEGLRAAAVIRAEHPEIAIMVLSAYVADAYVAELLDSAPGGGIGYLLKDRVSHVREFLDSLDRVAAGETVVDPQVVRQLLGRRRDDGPLGTLTDREREVLALMAEGRTNGSIADAARGERGRGPKARRQHLCQAPARPRLRPTRLRRSRLPARLTYMANPSQASGAGGPRS
jgi:DNA-binding NarL/FixJ family response regulator